MFFHILSSIVSSTKSAVTANTTCNDLSVSNLPNTNNAVYGNWLRVTNGEKSVVLRLPKSYESKLSLTCISEDIAAGSYSIQIAMTLKTLKALRVENLGKKQVQDLWKVF